MCEEGSDTVIGSITTITNSHTPESTEQSVLKVWEDDGNRDGVRPAELTVRLQGDDKDVVWAVDMKLSGDDEYAAKHVGEPVEVKLSDANSWAARIENLPKYQAGKEVKYTWKEIDLPATYTMESNNTFRNITTITNKHNITKTNVKVLKVWNDGENRDAKRPQELKVTLYKFVANMRTRSTPVVGEYTLNEKNGWSAEVLDLPANENGSPINYYWSEEMPENYTLQNNDIKPSQTWETGTGGNKQTVVGTITTLMNTYEPTRIPQNIYKVWDDADDQDGARPTAITVKLFKQVDGTKEAVKWYDGMALASDAEFATKNLNKEVVLTLNSATGWSDRVLGLYQREAGKDITYSWEEVSARYADGSTRDFETKGGKTVLSDASGNTAYEMTGNAFSPTTATGIQNLTTISNLHAPELTESHVKKEWNDGQNQDGVRPTSLEVTLLANNAPAYWTQKMLDSSKNAAIAKDKKLGDPVTVTLNEDNGWSADIYDLNAKSAGKGLVYTWAELAVPTGYTFQGSELVKKGDISVYVLTNKHVTEPTAVTVVKAWDDSNNQDGFRPTSISVKLLADGAAVAKDKDGKVIVNPVTLNAANNWAMTIGNLPKYKDGGSEVKYTWAEVSCDWTGIDGMLQMDGEWYYSYDNAIAPANGHVLPDGTVDSEPLYTQLSNATDGTTTTITNLHKPMMTAAKVSKVWDDDDDRDALRPTKITVYLTKNGVRTDKSVVLSVDNDWTAEISELPMYENGESVSYTWEEEIPSGYKLKIGGTIANWTLTNTLIRYATAKVTKVWDDIEEERDFSGSRPKELIVKLMQTIAPEDGTPETKPVNGTFKVNGAETEIKDGEVVLKASDNEEHNWAATVEGLPVVDEKENAIIYKWSEEAVDVPAGYRLDNISADVADGVVTATLTNHKLRGKLRLTKTVHTPKDELTEEQRKLIQFKVKGAEIDTTLSLADFKRVSSETEGAPTNLVYQSEDNETLLMAGDEEGEPQPMTLATASTFAAQDDTEAKAANADVAPEAQADDEESTYLATKYVWESDWLDLTGDPEKDAYHVQEINSMYQWIDYRTYQVNQNEPVTSKDGVDAVVLDPETDVFISDTLVPPALVISKELINASGATADAEFTFNIELTLDEEAGADSVAARNDTWKNAEFIGTLSTDGTTTDSPVQFRDGKASIKLKGGQTQTIEYLPIGVKYLVTEADSGKIALTDIAGTGTVDLDKRSITDVISTKRVDDHVARFTNTAPTGDVRLQVKKVVSGSTYTGNEDFKFQLAKSGAFSKTFGTLVKTSDVLPADTTATAKAGATATFGAITYTEPGLYFYTITELAPANKTTGMSYDTSAHYVCVLVDDDLKATVGYEFALKTTDDFSKLTVEETLKRLVDGLAAGTYNLKSAESLIVTNTYTPPEEGKLIVRKVVSSTRSEDKTRAFAFKVTLSNKTINGKYGDMEFKDGVATFALKHNETKTATGLPLGTTGLRCTVEETDAGGLTPSIVKNNTTSDATLSFTCTNTYTPPTTPPTTQPTTPTTTTTLPTTTRTVYTTSGGTATPKTSDPTSTAPVALLAASGLASLAAGFRRRRK